METKLTNLRAMKKQWCLLSLSCILMAVFSGCVAVVAAGGAAGGVAYVRGDLQVDLEESVKDLNDAVEDAGEKLELNRISGERDMLGGKFVYRDSQDQKITITTNAETDNVTALSIRIGIFGDEAKSMRILDAIKSEL